MEKHRLKYVDEMICFQEVPNETTISFSISNCPYRCKGCHSSYLQSDCGIPLLDIIESRIEFYTNLITCVLFMGGDDSAQVDELISCLQICKQHKLKTALYSGASNINNDILNYLDYIKIGPYVESLGALQSKTTNQRFYKKTINNDWEDITSWFQTKRAVVPPDVTTV